MTFCLNDGVPSAGEIVPYWPDQIEDQLKRAARRYFARLFRVDRREKRALLPRVLSWVRNDFGRDRAERLAMLGDLMDPDQRRALFECGKRANGIHYTCNDQTLGFACPSAKLSSNSSSSKRVHRKERSVGAGLDKSLSRSGGKSKSRGGGGGDEAGDADVLVVPESPASDESGGSNGRRRKKKTQSLRGESTSRAASGGGGGGDDESSNTSEAASDSHKKKGGDGKRRTHRRKSGDKEDSAAKTSD